MSKPTEDQIRVTDQPNGRMVNVSGAIDVVKDNLEAVAGPTSGDNFASGYQQGSLWIYSGTFYICTGDGAWQGFNATDIASALSGKQPLAANLTDIAAMSNTAGGLFVGGGGYFSLLTNTGQNGFPLVINTSTSLDVEWGPITQSAVTGLSVSLAGKQPIDQDLTDIAALTRTKGDLLVGGPSSWVDLPAGTNGLPLVANSAATNGLEYASLAQSSVTSLVTDLSNKQPLDADLTAIAGLTRTAGDLIIGGSSAWTDLAVGSTNQVLTVIAGSPAWASMSESLVYLQAIQGTVTTSTTLQTIATTSAVAATGTYLVEIRGSIVLAVGSSNTGSIGFRINSGSDVLNETLGVASGEKVSLSGFSAQVSLTAGDTVSLRARNGSATPRISLVLWKVS